MDTTLEGYAIAATLFIIGILLSIFSPKVWPKIDRKFTEWYPWLSKFLAYDHKTKRLSWTSVETEVAMWRVSGIVIAFASGITLILWMVSEII